MPLKKTPIILILFLLIAGSLQAQPWQAIEGRYARVEYQPQHATLADSLLKIAEEALVLAEEERKQVYRVVCRSLWNRISKAWSF